MNSKYSKYENWVTIIKGMTMILVIFEHSLLDSNWFAARIILMFHMPLFFFISGYCYRDSPSNNCVKYRKKNTIKTLRIVAVIGAFSFPFYILKDYLKHDFSGSKILRYCMDFIYCNSVNGHTFGGGYGLL